MIISPEVLLLCRINFAILGFLLLQNVLYNYIELIWNFDGYFIESVDCLENIRWGKSKLKIVLNI